MVVDQGEPEAREDQPPTQRAHHRHVVTRSGVRLSAR
jgi:hypothetical protein